MALSSLVAAIGLVSDNVAVIIGAMVIAPLLGPNTTLSFAVVLGDWDLAKRSAKTMSMGVVIALVLAYLLGLAFGIDPTSQELVSRSSVSFGDLVLALASGAAGALAFTTGMSSALVGVMVAVALLPPLAACGLFIAGGLWASAPGAGLLFLVNMAAVNLAGVVVFMIQQIKPALEEEAARAQKMTLIFEIAWVIALGLLLTAIKLSVENVTL